MLRQCSGVMPFTLSRSVSVEQNEFLSLNVYKCTKEIQFFRNSSPESQKTLNRPIILFINLYLNLGTDLPATVSVRSALYKHMLQQMLLLLTALSFYNKQYSLNNNIEWVCQNQLKLTYLEGVAAITKLQQTVGCKQNH